MPQSNRKLKEELTKKEKLNSEMAKQIKKNAEFLESVKKKIANYRHLIYIFPYVIVEIIHLNISA